MAVEWSLEKPTLEGLEEALRAEDGPSEEVLDVAKLFQEESEGATEPKALEKALAKACSRYKEQAEDEAHSEGDDEEEKDEDSEEEEEEGKGKVKKSASDASEDGSSDDLPELTAEELEALLDEGADPEYQDASAVFGAVVKALEAHTAEVRGLRAELKAQGAALAEVRRAQDAVQKSVRQQSPAEVVTKAVARYEAGRLKELRERAAGVERRVGDLEKAVDGKPDSPHAPLSKSASALAAAVSMGEASEVLKKAVEDGKLGMNAHSRAQGALRFGEDPAAVLAQWLPERARELASAS